ncbi:MAG: hypothetical protein JW987_11955 [Anaerolineaceae bacterium]|nr:hypothetical protein [Anaerolineaceae bacterium]
MKLSPRQTAIRYGVSAALAACGSLLALLAFSALPAQVAYRIHERYTFSNPGPESTFALGVLLPKSGPYQQVSTPESIGARPVATHQNPDTQVLLFEAPLPPGDTTVDIAYTATLKQGPARWDGSTTPADLAEQPGIEVNGPEIQALAEQMPGAAEDAILERFTYTARALNWPTGPRINVESSAVTALSEGIGGCTEFSFLFTALNRAAGVPTRSISGLAFQPLPPFIESKSTWNHPAGAHAWVEFYDGKQWAFGDPSWVSFRNPRRFFGRADGAHLSYGEFSQEAAALQEIQAWVEERGQMVGGMTAPLKFSAASPAANVTFTPIVTVKKTADSRWWYGLFGFAAMIALVKLGDVWLVRRFTAQNHV